MSRTKKWGRRGRGGAYAQVSRPSPAPVGLDATKIHRRIHHLKAALWESMDGLQFDKIPVLSYEDMLNPASCVGLVRETDEGTANYLDLFAGLIEHMLGNRATYTDDKAGKTAVNAYVRQGTYEALISKKPGSEPDNRRKQQALALAGMDVVVLEKVIESRVCARRAFLTSHPKAEVYVKTLQTAEFDTPSTTHQATCKDPIKSEASGSNAAPQAQVKNEESVVMSPDGAPELSRVVVEVKAHSNSEPDSNMDNDNSNLDGDQAVIKPEHNASVDEQNVSSQQDQEGPYLRKFMWAIDKWLSVLSEPYQGGSTWTEVFANKQAPYVQSLLQSRASLE